MKQWSPLLIGALAGIVFTYLCGAMVAWEFDPGAWSTFWRLICATCAVFWASFGATIGLAVRDA